MVAVVSVRCWRTSRKWYLYLSDAIIVYFGNINWSTVAPAAYYTGTEKYRGEDGQLTPYDPEEYGYPVEQTFPRGGPTGPKKPILSPVKRDYASGGTLGPLKPIPMLVETSYPMREPLGSTKPVSWPVVPSYPQWEPMDQMKPSPLPVKLKYPTLESVGLSNPQTEHAGPRYPLPGYVDSHRGPKMTPDRFFTSVAPRKPVYKAKRPGDLLKYPRKPHYLTIRTRYVPKHPAWRRKSRWVS